MKNSYAYNYFSYYSADDRFRKGNFLLLEVKIKIAHRQKLHNYVDICLILKGFSNTGQKILMSDALNHIALKHIKFSDLGLLNDFHRVLLTSFLIFSQDYAPETTLSKILLALIVLWTSTVFFGLALVIGIELRILITWSRHKNTFMYH